MKRPALAYVLSLALSLASSSALAGTIMLSGDSNIGNAVDGSGTGINVGNQLFFSNILQSGTNVLILDSGGLIGSLISSQAAIDAFYDAMLAVTSTVTSGTISDATLAGVDLFITMLPDAFGGSELSALANFLAAGGTAFFLGENSNTAFTATNAAINSALLALGSGLTLVPDTVDVGFNTTASIGAHAFTAGVTSFTYAATSRVSGGTPLFFTLTGNRPFVAVEQVEAVPEPSTLLLLGAGIAGLVRHRRRVHPSRD